MTAITPGDLKIGGLPVPLATKSGLFGPLFLSLRVIKFKVTIFMQNFKSNAVKDLAVS